MEQCLHRRELGEADDIPRLLLALEVDREEELVQTLDARSQPVELRGGGGELGQIDSHRSEVSDVGVVPNLREFSEAREERGVDLEHRLVEAAEPRRRMGDDARERVLGYMENLSEKLIRTR